MVFPLFAAIGTSLLGLLMSLVAIFLILLVLVQRGRGGGLAGALGGMGGSSAFGAKAGDVFTKITIVAASIWILLCIAATRFGASSQSLLDLPDGSPASSSAATDPANSSGAAEADDAAAKAPADAATAPAASEAAAPAPGDAPTAAETTTTSP